jgi:PKD repeat protein
MKKLNYFFALIIASGSSLAGKAQLAGSYTIGGTTPDYATVTDAVNDLVAQGVQSPCTFFIRPGTYTSMLNYNPLNYSYPVEFRSETGNAADVKLTMGNVYQSRNIIFSNITIVPHRNTSYIYNHKGLEIGNSSYITFDSCVVRGTSNVDERNGLCVALDHGYIYFTNCSFRNLDAAIIYSETTHYQGSNRHYNDHVVRNCDFDSVGIAFYIAGDFNGADDSLHVADCRVIHCTTGIIINGNSENVENVKFFRNSIYATTTGISINSNNPTLHFRPLTFINNMVSASAAVSGGTSQNFDFYNNSFYGQVNFMGCTRIWFYNNSVHYPDTNIAFWISDATTWYAGNNNYYAPNITGDMFFGGNTSPITLPDLAAFQNATADDTGSISADPMYISTSDLHSISPYLKYNGRPLANVQNDLDGELRNNPAPDIGADEYQASPLPPYAYYYPVCSVTQNYTAMLLDTSVRDAGSGWDFGDAGTSASESPSHTWTGPGPYTVTQIVSNPWGTDTNTQVMQFPAVVPIVSLNGMQMTVTNGPYTAFQWYFNGTPITNATASSFTAPFNGNYTVLVWDAVCTCPYISATIAVGVAEHELTNVTISPNPAHDELVISVPETTTDALQYEIFDATGRLVSSFANSAAVNRIDLSGYERGAYTIRITNGSSGAVMSRLIMKI